MMHLRSIPLLALLRSGHVAVIVAAYWSIARMLQVGTFNLRHLAGRGSARPRDAQDRLAPPRPEPATSP